MLLLLACTTTEDSAAPAREMLPLFSFAVLADPHITTDPERQARLAGAVDWINANAAQEDLRMVWVVGDIGWGDGLPLSRQLLDELEVPYWPVIGDNEVHFGDEVLFEQTFGPVLEDRRLEFPDLERGTVTVTDPATGREMALQNFSFAYEGVTWIGLDWCSRDEDGLLSEFAELHDVDGGTLPFLDGELSVLEPTDAEDVLLFSHHPMHLGSFDLLEMEELARLIGPVGGRVGASFAGHIHQNATVPVPELDATAYVTDATWDDENTVRLVRVLGDGVAFTLEQELVEVPW